MRTRFVVVAVAVLVGVAPAAPARGYWPDRPPPIDAGSAVPNPAYLEGLPPIDAGSGAPNPAALQGIDKLPPIDAGSDIPNPAYLPGTLVRPTPTAPPVASPLSEPTGGFGWLPLAVGIGAGVLLVALAAVLAARHHRPHGHAPAH